MHLLAIDTSANASAALLEISDPHNVRIIGSFTSVENNDHAEALAPAIQMLLNEATLDGKNLAGIAVGVGPGPFTGLRVGLATARTLSFVWGVPLHGVMSLDAICFDAVRSGVESDFIVAIDARRKEVYWARYDVTGALLDGPNVTVVEELPALPVYGSGAGLYSERLEATGAKVSEEFRQTNPSAVALGTRAAQRLAAGEEMLSSEPLYLRESDAKVPAVMKGKLL
ncbi:tRNA (adenosine(37)-N6)-threonylcarbamoyltransferase complex dimerization subunit type 1 TsaB [Arthrobacter sp. MYb227]|uniref:tRNA (adenosine(37)-N6)-threonylcarbamoyltransferase complex dimerization subunit type 1 TsaB n=1 Tax=Arthrobacter sp. MYb227 TaxID=1848601 RepID=UPI000CFD773F|nr:tRNA (adenosine(37)-N6)-threonylcarbamoyltransferase complex dimerization subunit type 1 TsaB [Arthrobacter sp. MYb227]PQZ96057.1 tRNA (adenosine(37)-N6)-threonylcarbamoyltransferase complex dimerization subunit type 1 TsaB [Arthrobacter sp. MYb227]